MDNFPSGFYFNAPHERAPDFVLGSISIRPDVFVEWINEQRTNDKGYVKLQVKKSKKDGKPYCVVDTYGLDGKTAPRASQSVTEEDIDTIDASSIPF